MSEVLLRAGTQENPYSVDIQVKHDAPRKEIFCQLCEAVFRDKDIARARAKYLVHQSEKHKIKNPIIHSFEQDEDSIEAEINARKAVDSP